MRKLRFPLTAMTLAACSLLTFQSCKKDDTKSNQDPTPEPIEVKDFSASINENPEVGTVLGKIDKASYTIVSQSVEGAIKIDEQGQILVNDKAAFDFEQRTSITAEYMVKGDEANKANITISINDIKEHFVFTVQAPAGGKAQLFQARNVIYRYVIDWGDGTPTEPRGTQHTYAKAGNYTIKIMGSSPTFQYSEGSSAQILSIDAWGDNEWTSFYEAFQGSKVLEIKATDMPVLTKCTNMRYMFNGCKKLNADLSGWDVSNVTNMTGTFQGTTSFEGDLSNWDVSKVTDCACFSYDSKMTKKPALTCNTGCQI